MESDDGDAKLSELAMWPDSQLFSEAERVALEYAERVTITDQRVDDVLFSRLTQHYTEAQIVELTAAITFENYRSKFNPSLGVDAQGFLSDTGTVIKYVKLIRRDTI